MTDLHAALTLVTLDLPGLGRSARVGGRATGVGAEARGVSQSAFFFALFFAARRSGSVS
jgi:hypothetical protein